MTGGIAVRNLDTAGGRQLAGGQNWFFVEGEPAVLLGDPVEPHPIGLPHLTAVMAEGSAWFNIGGVPVCREGHLASCGHATTGRPWFLIEG